MDLDQGQQMGGIEVMDADDPFRGLHIPGDFRDRDAARVAGQDDAPRKPVKTGKEPFLDIEDLGDRLDDVVRPLEGRVQIADLEGRDSRERSGKRFLEKPIFLHQLEIILDAHPATLESFRVTIDEADRQTRLGKSLGDALPHGPRTHDSDSPNPIQCHGFVLLVLCPFLPFLSC